MTPLHHEESLTDIALVKPRLRLHTRYSNPADLSFLFTIMRLNNIHHHIVEVAKARCIQGVHQSNLNFLVYLQTSATITQLLSAVRARRNHHHSG